MGCCGFVGEMRLLGCSEFEGWWGGYFLPFLMAIVANVLAMRSVPMGIAYRLCCKPFF